MQAQGGVVMPATAARQSRHSKPVIQHLMAILKLLDICHEGDHSLPSPSDEELVPDFHFWLDAKPGTNSQQALHSVPSVSIQAAKGQLCITWSDKAGLRRIVIVRCSQAHL